MHRNTSNCLINNSYYEFYDPEHNIYIGKYPSDKTDAPVIQIPDPSIRVGKLLMNCIVSADDVMNLCRALEQNTFGFYDNIGYLCDNLITRATSLTNGKPLVSLDAGNIATHLASLYIKTVTRAKNHDVLIVGSHNDSAFEIILYARAQTAIQEAIDLFLLYVKEEIGINDSRKIMTTLGYKKKSDNYQLCSKTELCNVLKIGMTGHLPGPGEHLEANEKKEVNKIRTDHAVNIAQNDPVRLTDVSRISTRAAIEEVGVNLDLEKHVGRFCVGVHTRAGRDPRYWTFNQKTIHGTTIFGYERPSHSIMIVAIIPCKKFPELGEPTDTVECSKAQLIEFDHLCQEFRFGGKYPPAFPAHVEQLAVVKTALPKMLNQYFNEPKVL